MKPAEFNGLLGASVFMAGAVIFYGLGDLIDRIPMEGLTMQAQKKSYDVAAQMPVTAAVRVDHCKNCGRPVFVPADREPHVLGTLCSTQCERDNTEHYK